MAQKRKSLKKSFRKNTRSTRRKSKTNKRKSRKIRGGGFFSTSEPEEDKFATDVNNLDTTNMEETDKVHNIRELANRILVINKCDPSCKQKLFDAYSNLIKKSHTITNETDRANLKGRISLKSSLVNTL